MASLITTDVDSTFFLHLLSSAISTSPNLFPSGALYLAFTLLGLSLSVALIIWAYPGGPAWGLRGLLKSSATLLSLPPIPGPHGLPFLGSLLTFARTTGDTAPHRRLAALASRYHARALMALSLGSTRVVVSSEPSVAREILCNAAFSERPLSQTARQLLFARAVGFAPNGQHWRNLRRLAAVHLFSPRRISAHEHLRQLDASEMLDTISANLSSSRVQTMRPYLQHAALNNIMGTVFGKRYEFSSGKESGEAAEVGAMVREGFELLGAFNIVDHIPSAFESIDPLRVRQRCDALVPRVYSFVQQIIDEHRQRSIIGNSSMESSSDFVDVLLGLQTQEKLTDSDMIAILWEMIFRGTDTMAILTEWILAELVLNPQVQAKLYGEVRAAAEQCRGDLRDADIARMPYLQAVVKEGLRMHPPGPLLSWARLAIHDVEVSGHLVPAGTTAMVNMWAITHDVAIWAEPEKFKPERFIPSEGGEEVTVQGSDLRLAPFGAGARVCPGKTMAMAAVSLWVARVVQRFELLEDDAHPVDLTDMLKLSCEMAMPLSSLLYEREAQS